MSFHTLRGTAWSLPVVGSTGAKVLKDLGFHRVIVNGLLTEPTVTPVYVPPSAVTAYCLPLLSGAVSAVSVYVGDVKPVWLPPVTGDEGLNAMSITSSKEG